MSSPLNKITVRPIGRSQPVVVVVVVVVAAAAAFVVVITGVPHNGGHD